MDSLQAIVNSLSAGEKKLLQHFYKMKSYGEYRKRAQLFDLLSKGKNMNEATVSKTLGYSTANSSFNNVKTRLKSDILCIMLMQEPSTKFNTPYAQAMFSCRRSLIQGELLMSRGVYDEAITILQKAARLAARYELFGEQALIEDLMRNHLALHGNALSYEAMTSSIEESYVRFGYLLHAKSKHYELLMPVLLNILCMDDYLEQGAHLANDLMNLSHKSGSRRIKLYAEVAALHYFSLIGDYQTALEHSEALLAVVENDPIVMSKSNQGGILLKIAGICLNSGEYQKAITHSVKAGKLFKPEMINQLYALLSLFFAYLRNGDTQKAESVLNSAFRHRLIKDQPDSPFYARLQLLQAWSLFSKGDLDECILILRENSELSRDKDGWMPGFLLLELMVLLEKNAYELAFYKIDAFRKTLERSPVHKDKRITIIVRLLRYLARHKFDYHTLSRENNAEILLLSEGKSKYYWDPAGYEVIRFEQWLNHKIAKYTPKPEVVMT